MVLLLLAGLVLRAQDYTEIKVSQLPKATQDYIQRNLSGQKITRVVKSENNGVLTYGVAFETGGNKRVLVFDKDGKYIQKGDRSEAGQNTVKQAPGSGTVKPAGNTATPVSADKLPVTIQNYIKTNYPSGKIAVSNQIRENNVDLYQVTVIDGNKSHVLTFDTKGKYLSEQTFVRQK